MITIRSRTADGRLVIREWQSEAEIRTCWERESASLQTELIQLVVQDGLVLYSGLDPAQLMQPRLVLSVIGLRRAVTPHEDQTSESEIMVRFILFKWGNSGRITLQITTFGMSLDTLTTSREMPRHPDGTSD